MDTRTEKIILDNLKSSRANKTTLLIAHRISTVEQLDKIIFLDDGKIEPSAPTMSCTPAAPRTAAWWTCSGWKMKPEVMTMLNITRFAGWRRHRCRYRAA